MLLSKSALIIRATGWGRLQKVKLNEEPMQMTVLEGLSVKTLVDSGTTQSTGAQIANLGQVAARRIEAWMHEQHEVEVGLTKD